MTFDSERNQYPLEDYKSPRPCLDNIGRVQYLVGKQFKHEDAIEDHWMTVVDDYDIQIRDYYRMTLYFIGNALKIKVPLKVVQQDTVEVLDPLYNKDKIYNRLVMNAKIDREENVDINHRARYII